MPITVWSINMRRCVEEAGPEVEAGTFKWLKTLAIPGTPIPDVLCLQDFRIELAPYLSRLPHITFAAMTDHLIWGERQLVGIAIASRHPLIHRMQEFTWGDGVIRRIEGVDDKNHRFDPKVMPDVDERVNKTEARRIIAATVVVDGVYYRIATTHGFWTRGGEPTAEQAYSTGRLIGHLRSDSMKYGGSVLDADLNLDKKGVTLDQLTEGGGRDCLPPEIKTTLAPTHPAAKFGAKPDRVMLWPDRAGNYAYYVLEAHMDYSPGSDHGMLCTTIAKK